MATLEERTGRGRGGLHNAKFTSLPSYGGVSTDPSALFFSWCTRWLPCTAVCDGGVLSASDAERQRRLQLIWCVQLAAERTAAALHLCLCYGGWANEVCVAPLITCCPSLSPPLFINCIHIHTTTSATPVSRLAYRKHFQEIRQRSPSTGRIDSASLKGGSRAPATHCSASIQSWRPHIAVSEFPCRTSLWLAFAIVAAFATSHPLPTLLPVVSLSCLFICIAWRLPRPRARAFSSPSSVHPFALDTAKSAPPRPPPSFTRSPSSPFPLLFADFT